jgi:glycosyltransferase involved in cell wall biosynthesis
VAEPVTAFPAILNRFKKRPVVIDWDDLYGKGGYARLKPARFIMEPLMTTLEERVLRLGRKVTVVSEALEEKALQVGISSAKIHRIPNGADSDFIMPLDKAKCRRDVGLPEDKKIILNMERNNALTPGLMDIFEKVSVNIPGIMLVCLGDINKKSFNCVFRKKLAKLIEEKKLILAGPRPYREVPLYLGAADVLILFMEDNVIEASRSPLRVGDYLSSGRPIVASDIGEAGYILKKYRCGLVADTENKFIDNIAMVLKERSISEDYGNRARKVAEEELRWETVARKMLEVYRGLCQKR